MRTALTLLLALPLVAQADVPLQLTHQGRLFDASGNALQGDHELKITIYDAPSGGATVWSDAIAGVAFSNGYYAVDLGDSVPFELDAFENAVDGLWLGLSVDTSPPLPQRLPLQSVPYAFIASRADVARSVQGGTVDATEVTVGGAPVIHADGTIDWATIAGAPQQLGDLQCGLGEIAQWNGGSWGCAMANAHEHSAEQLTSGTLSLDVIPIGTSQLTVARGNHTHTALDVDLGALDNSNPLNHLRYTDNEAIAAVGPHYTDNQAIAAVGPHYTDNDAVLAVGPHTSRYTDTEAIAAVGPHTPAYTDSMAVAAVGPHTTRYTDTEAIAAVGPHTPAYTDSMAVAAVGPHTTRYTDAEAKTAVGPHTTRYTDAEAKTAVGPHTTRYTDAEAKTAVGPHTPAYTDSMAIAAVGPHTTRYTDAEAKTAVGPHTTRYTDAEAVTAVTNADRYVLTTGDTMTGALVVDNTVNALRYAVRDTRAVNDAPTVFNNEVRYEFKQRSAVGAPGSGTYGGQITMAPWGDDSGDASHQLHLNEGGIFWRQGQPNASAWGAWERVWTGGNPSGNSNADIIAYVQKVACENRRGVWIDGSGCQEYAYFTNACQYGACACAAGHHMCTFIDLYSGGFQSLRRPGYNNPTAYSWIAGNYPGQNHTMFYTPWGQQADNVYGTCRPGTHYMWYTARGAGGSTAWGCYPDTYTSASAACCRNNQ